MPAAPSPRDQSRFVFEGTVRNAKGATLSQLAREPNVAVVSVDRIVRGPDVLSDFAGRDITVKLIDGKPLKARAQATFYTNAWIMAEGLAVEALDYEPTPAAAGVAAMAATRAASDSLQEHDVESRVATADVVISGRVSAIHVVDDPPAAAVAALAAGGAPSTTRVSEHAPIWREAVIDVTGVHKGKHEGKTARVRYPASTDVRWYKAAKFEPGQEGYFILHKMGTRAARRQAAAAAGVTALPDHEAEAYTALHPADFQPFDADDEIKKLVTRSAASRSARRRRAPR
jgi:hypothetical protein